MSLFPFFKKKERTGTDSTLDSSDLLKGQIESGEKEQSVKTALFLPVQWSIAKEQEYVLRFLSNELPPLKPNQISLAGISINLNPSGKSLHIEAFVRSSINQPINLGTAELLLLDDKEAVIASHEFDFAEIGEIPANSNVPWVFEFPESSITGKEIPADGWKLAFDLLATKEHRLDLEGEWGKGLSDEVLEQLTVFVESLPPVKPNQVNVTGFNSSFTSEGGLSISLLIRNGSRKNFQMNKIPLEVRDASDTAIAKGVFELKDFIVKRNTSKPWTFVFPKENLFNTEPDMSKWTVSIIQK